MKHLLYAACISASITGFSNSKAQSLPPAFIELMSHFEQFISFGGSNEQECRNAGMYQIYLNNKRATGYFSEATGTCTIMVFGAGANLPVNGSFDVGP